MDKERDGRKGEENEGEIREREGKGNGREGVIIKAVGSGSTSTYMCIYI